MPVRPIHFRPIPITSTRLRQQHLQQQPYNGAPITPGSAGQARPAIGPQPTRPTPFAPTIGLGPQMMPGHRPISHGTYPTPQPTQTQGWAQSNNAPHMSSQMSGLPHYTGQGTWQSQAMGPPSLGNVFSRPPNLQPYDRATIALEMGNMQAGGGLATAGHKDIRRGTMEAAGPKRNEGGGGYSTSSSGLTDAGHQASTSDPNTTPPPGHEGETGYWFNGEWHQQDAPGAAEQTGYGQGGYSGSGQQGTQADSDAARARQNMKPGDTVEGPGGTWTYLGDQRTGADEWRKPDGTTSWYPPGYEGGVSPSLGLNEGDTDLAKKLDLAGFVVNPEDGTITDKNGNDVGSIYDKESWTGSLAYWAKQNNQQPAEGDPLAPYKDLFASLGDAPQVDQKALDEMISAARNRQQLDASRNMIIASETAGRARTAPGFQSAIQGQLGLENTLGMADNEAKQRWQASMANMQSALQQYQTKAQQLAMLASYSQDAKVQQAAVAGQKELARYMAELQAEIQAAQSQAPQILGSIAGGLGGLGSLGYGIGSLITALA